MRTLILLLSSLMLMVASAGLAQAAEIGACPEMSQAAHAPVFCDGDEAPADCDKNCPRALNCHGHHVGTAVADVVGPVVAIYPGTFDAQRAGTLASRAGEQALRPPQA